MSAKKLMTLALCAVACATVNGKVRTQDLTSPAVAKSKAPYKLLNPEPGMIMSVYGPQEWMRLDDVKKMKEQFRESVFALPKSPAVKTSVDKSDKFSIDCAKDVEVSAIRWEGYLVDNESETCTFVMQKNYYYGYDRDCLQTGYAVMINDVVVCGWGQQSFDVNLEPGYNKVVIVCLYPDERKFADVNKAPFNITVKPKGSVEEPSKLTPAMFEFDKTPERAKKWNDRRRSGGPVR